MKITLDIKEDVSPSDAAVIFDHMHELSKLGVAVTCSIHMTEGRAITPDFDDIKNVQVSPPIVDIKTVMPPY